MPEPRHVARTITARRLAGAAYRRLPRGPFRYVMPTRPLRGVFRFWLSVLAADPDPTRAVRELLTASDDVYESLDAAAIRYDGGIHAKHRLTHYHDFFVERVEPGERVLDLGSGKGELAYDLATVAGATVVGVDKDESHLEFARSHFPHRALRFYEADVLEWLPQGHFDVVVLSNVLEHLGPRTSFLRRIVASATPRRFLFRVPVHDREWTVPLKEEVGLDSFGDLDHEIEYDADSFESEVRRAGLAVTELELTWGEIWASAEPADRMLTRA